MPRALSHEELQAQLDQAKRIKTEETNKKIAIIAIGLDRLSEAPQENKARDFLQYGFSPIRNRDTLHASIYTPNATLTVSTDTRGQNPIYTVYSRREDSATNDSISFTPTGSYDGLPRDSGGNIVSLDATTLEHAARTVLDRGVDIIDIPKK